MKGAKSAADAPAQDARPLVAMLPSGRAVWLRLQPAPATVREIDRVSGSMDLSYALKARSLDTNAAAAQRLRRAIVSEAADLGCSRARACRTLRERLERADARVEQRLDHALVPAVLRAKAQQLRQLEWVRGNGRREAWNQVVVITALTLLAAYGQQGRPLAENNLVIAIALGVWLFGDEISDLLAGRRALRVNPIRGTDWWSYLAPFANLLTGWWLLGDRQNERFIIGATDLPVGLPGETNVFAAVIEVAGDRQTDTCLALIDLSTRVAPEYLADFRAFDNVAVLATVHSLEPNPVVVGVQPEIELLQVDVTQGFLRIVVKVSGLVPGSRGDEPLARRLHVAWVVDTRHHPTAS